MTDKKIKSLLKEPLLYLSDYDLDFTETELEFLLIVYNSTDPGMVATIKNYKTINLKYAIRVLDEVKGLSEMGYLIVNKILKKLMEAKKSPVMHTKENPICIINYDDSTAFVAELETLLIGKESQEIHFPQVLALIQRYKNQNNPMLQ